MTTPDPTPHDETCARCDRRICVCGCQCATCAPVDRPAHADAVMADLGAAITEGVTEVRLRERIIAAINGAPTDQQWISHHDLRVMADAVLAVPEIRAALGGEG